VSEPRDDLATAPSRQCRELNFKRPRDREGELTSGAPSVLSLLYKGHEAHNGEVGSHVVKAYTRHNLSLLPACFLSAYMPVWPAACLCSYIFRTIAPLRAAVPLRLTELSQTDGKRQRCNFKGDRVNAINGVI